MYAYHLPYTDSIDIGRYKHTQGQSIHKDRAYCIGTVAQAKKAKQESSLPALCTKCVIMIFIIMIILLCYIIMMGTTFCTLPYYVLHLTPTTFCTIGVLHFAPMFFCRFLVPYLSYVEILQVNMQKIPP